MGTIRKLFLLSFGVCMGVLFVAAADEQKKLGKRRSTSLMKSQDIVDESSEESFPASDAPAWGPSSSNKLH